MICMIPISDYILNMTAFIILILCVQLVFWYIMPFDAYCCCSMKDNTSRAAYYIRGKEVGPKTVLHHNSLATCYCQFTDLLPHKIAETTPIVQGGRPYQKTMKNHFKKVQECIQEKQKQIYPRLLQLFFIILGTKRCRNFKVQRLSPKAQFYVPAYICIDIWHTHPIYLQPIPQRSAKPQKKPLQFGKVVENLRSIACM